MYHWLDTDTHVLLGFEWQEPTGSCLLAAGQGVLPLAWHATPRGNLQKT